MCFDPVTMAVVAGTVTALSSVVSQKMQIDGQNNAAAQSYNQQSRYAEQVNKAAITQQQQTDDRNRINTQMQAASAGDQARAAILQNQVAMGAARASAGTSGMMGLPLNMIEQNYQSLIGGIGTNLQTKDTQLDVNQFFNNQDTMLQAQSTSNQAIPMKPFMQKFGMMNLLSAGLSGASAGMGAYNPGAGVAKPADLFGGTGGAAGTIPRVNMNPGSLSF